MSFNNTFVGHTIPNTPNGYFFPPPTTNPYPSPSPSQWPYIQHYPQGWQCPHCKVVHSPTTCSCYCQAGYKVADSGAHWCGTLSGSDMLAHESKQLEMGLN